MKALILEEKDGRVAAMREDGEIVTLRRTGRVGESIEIDEAEAQAENIVKLPVKKRRWAQAAIAASLAFVLLTGSYTYTTALACSYISVETEEASVELSVNRLGRVIQVKALNEDSKALAETLSAELRHKLVEEALEQTVERFRTESGLTGGETIVAGVTDSDEQRAVDLAEKIERAVGGQNEVHTVEVSPEQREEAKEQDMGGGRFVWERLAPEQALPAPEPNPTEDPGDLQAMNPAPEQPELAQPEADRPAEQPAPAKPDSESEPPARQDKPVGNEPPAAVPEETPDASGQNGEPAPGKGQDSPTQPELPQESNQPLQQGQPQQQQQPGQQTQPEGENAARQRIPGNEAETGSPPTGEPQGANLPPQESRPINDRQPGQSQWESPGTGKNF